MNQIARQIEVYREPADGVYAFVALVPPGESLDALGLPGVEFAADDLLPPLDAAYD